MIPAGPVSIVWAIETTTPETLMNTTTPEQARDYFAQKLAFVTGPFELDGMVKRGEPVTIVDVRLPSAYAQRSEEHTSELQSPI